MMEYNLAKERALAEYHDKMRERRKKYGGEYCNVCGKFMKGSADDYNLDGPICTDCNEDEE